MKRHWSLRNMLCCRRFGFQRKLSLCAVLPQVVGYGGVGLEDSLRGPLNLKFFGCIPALACYGPPFSGGLVAGAPAPLSGGGPSGPGGALRASLCATVGSLGSRPLMRPFGFFCCFPALACHGPPVGALLLARWPPVGGGLSGPPSGGPWSPSGGALAPLAGGLRRLAMAGLARVR